MIKFLKNDFSINDDRGSIKGLVNTGNWRELNFFETIANQKRGAHYHKLTDELFIILKGKIKIHLSRVSEEGKLVGEKEHHVVSKGDVFIIPKLTFHAFEILEDTKWINGLSVKFDDLKPDIYKAI